MDPPQQRGQLLIGVAVLRVGEIQGQDGPDDSPGQPVGQKSPQGDGQCQHHQQGGDQLQHQGHHGALVAGHPQHTAVGESQGHIQRFGGQGIGIPGGLPHLTGEGLLDLLPLQVVLHSGGIGLGVIENAAVGIHPGDAVLRPQVRQIGLPLQLHAPGGQYRLHLQLVKDTGGIVAQQHRAE